MECDQTVGPNHTHKLFEQLADITHAFNACNLKHVVLEGKIFYEGKQKPRIGWDENVPLERDGGKEYMVMRDGTRKLARRWTPSISDFSYTQLGKKYFEARGEADKKLPKRPIFEQNSLAVLLYLAAYT